MAHSATVLVTGASSGIGQRIAEYLVQQGYTVYGTSRQPSAATVNGVALLKLDVTDEASVRACVEAVLAQAGRIDVLVNNAGVDYTGALEETSIDEYMRLFDVNFFGLIRMTRTVLPHMRAQGSGKIINIGSGMGSFGLPYQTAYAASKHAVKGLTDALNLEMEPFGIRAYVIQPGYFKSDILNRSQLPAQPIPAYDTPRQRYVITHAHRVNTGPDPLPIAQRVERIITGRARNWMQPVDTEAVAATLRGLVPPALFKRHILWRANTFPQEHSFYHRFASTLYRFIGRSDGDLPHIPRDE